MFCSKQHCLGHSFSTNWQLDFERCNRFGYIQNLINAQIYAAYLQNPFSILHHPHCILPFAIVNRQQIRARRIIRVC